MRDIQGKRDLNYQWRDNEELRKPKKNYWASNHWVGWGCTKSLEGTQLGQLISAGQWDVPNVASSAHKQVQSKTKDLLIIIIIIRWW